jgi:hypothetical protein
MRRGLGAALLTAALLAACSSQPSPDQTPPTAIAAGQGFALAMGVPADHFAVGQAIDVLTTLTWTGPAPKATIWGSGSGPVIFLFEDLTGRHRMPGGAMTADCAKHPFAQGVATSIPFHKSGGWIADDPDAAFFREFFADPLLRLPAGNWRITADVEGMLAECAANAPTISLRAALEIGVG